MHDSQPYAGFKLKPKIRPSDFPNLLNSGKIRTRFRHSNLHNNWKWRGWFRVDDS